MVQIGRNLEDRSSKPKCFKNIGQQIEVFVVFDSSKRQCESPDDYTHFLYSLSSDQMLVY